MELTYKITEDKGKVTVVVGGFGNDIVDTGWFGFTLGKYIERDTELGWKLECQYRAKRQPKADGLLTGNDGVDCAWQLVKLIKEKIEEVNKVTA